MNIIAVLLIIIALIYIISPYDLLPDLFPITGWFDDAFLLGVLMYYLKFRRLPGFLSRFLRSGSRPGQAGRGAKSEHSGFKEAGSQADSVDPYQILGIQPGAGPDEIRSAYRKAAQAYHPDKVSHLGPELRELAQKKFVEIQKAYDTLISRDRSGQRPN